MEFSAKEMAAVLKVAKAMAMADGKVTEEEKGIMIADLGCFGVIPNSPESVALERVANEMQPVEMFALLTGMNIDQKKYVCGFLAAVMSCDGKIDDSETKLWCLVSTLAGFPTMTIGDAVEFWGKN